MKLREVRSAGLVAVTSPTFVEQVAHILPGSVATLKIAHICDAHATGHRDPGYLSLTPVFRKLKV